MPLEVCCFFKRAEELSYRQGRVSELRAQSVAAAVSSSDLPCSVNGKRKDANGAWPSYSIATYGPYATFGAPVSGGDGASPGQVR